MTTKLRGGRLEAEVDRARTEGNWKRLSELLPSVRSKQSGMDEAGELLEAEIVLETFLEQQGEVLRPRKDHADVLKHAETLLLKCNQDKTSPVGLEAKLLLAKLYYASANYDKSLRLIEQSGMDSGSTPFRTLRVLRLIAEAYAIKALCLEIVEADDKISRGNKSYFCFEKAAELTISYVSELEKSIGSNSSKNINPLTSSSSSVRSQKQERIGDLLECCLERVAQLRVKDSSADKINDPDGIEWYRRIITCLGDKSTGERLQQKLSRQLAELLFRVVPADCNDSSQVLSTKAKNLNFYAGSQRAYFSPASRTEEIILLLLISEVLATREVVLSRSDDLAASRLQSVRNAKSVYNLLTLVLSTIRQYHLMSVIFERAMKFANEDSYIWQQFGLSLLCKGRWLRAANVLDQSIQVDSSEAPLQHLLASQLYIHQLGQFDIAYQHAQKARDLCSNAHFAYLRPRCLLMAALAQSLKAQNEVCWEDKRKGLLKAVTMFEECVNEDPHDYLSLYYCALYHAIVRDLDGARDRCARSLERNPDQPSAIMLLALIFTAAGDLKGALELVANALKDFPSHYGLLVLRLHIEIKFGRVDESLETCTALLEFWKKKESSFYDEDKVQTTLNATEAANLIGTKAATPVGGKEPSVAGSHHPTSISLPYTASVLGTASSQVGLDISADSGVAQSEVGGQSSNSDSVIGGLGNGFTWSRFRAQANMWMALAELFLSQNRVSDVGPCVEQAVALFPHSYQVLYLKGRLFSVRADNSDDEHIASRLRAEAKAAYLSALALSPSHGSSLQHLAVLYEREDNHKMAEQLYRELVRVDPMNCDGWQQLGCCQMRRGLMKEASESLATAANLDRSTPLLPFSAIPIVFPSGF
ncbi:unnamed protein product [Auanema sp. JU1783]|nr:unnamed protein product [Auanema sp. JU1783]